MTSQTEALKFQSLSVSRNEYGSDKGRLRATVKCSRYDTQLEVKLPDDIVLEIMRLCAPAIAAQVNAALLDVARGHEDWMIEDAAAQAAKQLPVD